MATYQNIKGLRVKYLSADPSNIADGEVWYNTTSGTLKAQVLTEATSSVNNMNTGRYAIGSAGTLTAGLAAAGDLFPAPSHAARASNATEEYDGTSWASATDIGTGRSFFASCGTQTAAIGSSGYPFSGPTTTATEEYDGTSWSSGTAVPTACEGGNQFGIQTASIFIEGGMGPSYPALAYTQTGGVWASIPSLNNDKNYGAMTNGTTAAGISVGGGHPVQSHVEEWDGTSWAASTAFPTTNYAAAGNSCGTQTAMAVAGGDGPGTQITIWDGSTWSISPASLATSRSGRPASAGTSTAFYVAGGPQHVTATEEFSTDPAVETITVS